MVCGKPLSQFMLCCVEPTLPTTDLATGWVSTAAIIATVVVLPADPVTSITNGLRDFTTQDDQNDKKGTKTRCIGICLVTGDRSQRRARSEEHTTELQLLMRIPYAVFCLKKTNNRYQNII